MPPMMQARFQVCHANNQQQKYLLRLLHWVAFQRMPLHVHIPLMMCRNQLLPNQYLYTKRIGWQSLHCLSVGLSKQRKHSCYLVLQASPAAKTKH